MHTYFLQILRDPVSVILGMGRELNYRATSVLWAAAPVSGDLFQGHIGPRELFPSDPVLLPTIPAPLSPLHTLPKDLKKPH